MQRMETAEFIEEGGNENFECQTVVFRGYEDGKCIDGVLARAYLY